jgi:hypothetical protein
LTCWLSCVFVLFLVSYCVVGDREGEGRSGRKSGSRWNEQLSACSLWASTQLLITLAWEGLWWHGFVSAAGWFSHGELRSHCVLFYDVMLGT